MANMFNEDGTYNKTEWKAGDKITAVKLNKIELSLEAINNNDINRHVEADSRLDILEERIAGQNEVTNERIEELNDLMIDNKYELDLEIYDINSRMTILEEEINDVAEVDLAELHAKNEELSEQLEHIENLNKYFEDDVLLIPTYGGFHGNSNPSNLELYVTNDCKKAFNVNIRDIFTSNTGKGQWDMCGNYYNGEFLIVTDYDSNSDGSGGDKINFIATENFETYREWQVTLPDEYTRVWAPELYIDDKNIYILVSLCVNNATTTNIDGTVVPYFETYFIKSLNSELTNWSDPVKINFPDNTNRIDPCVIKRNGSYYIFIKNEYNFTIEQYRKNTSFESDSVWEYIQTIDIPTRTEAPSVINMNNKYYLFSDAFSFLTRTYWVNESYDLINWSESYKLENPNRDTMRHFSPILLDNEEKKNKVKNLMLRERISCDIVTSNSLLRFFDNKNNNDLNGFELEWIAKDNVIDKLTVSPNTFYYISRGEVVVNSLDISNLKSGDVFYFMVNSSSEKCSLTLKNSPQTNSPMPMGYDYCIGKKFGNNEVLDGFIVIEGWLKHFKGTDIQTYIKNASIYTKHLLPSGLSCDIGTLENPYNVTFAKTQHIINESNVGILGSNVDAKRQLKRNNTVISENIETIFGTECEQWRLKVNDVIENQIAFSKYGILPCYFSGKNNRNLGYDDGTNIFRWSNIYLNNAPNISSNRELKEEINLYDDNMAYEGIKKIPIYSYKMKDRPQDSEEVYYGSMLDELPDECKHVENNGVDLYGYTSYVISALKIAINKIEELEKKVQQLENK